MSAKETSCTLIIAPYWNWNYTMTGTMPMNSWLIIAPYWNWNIIKNICLLVVSSLIIAPYWNWNNITPSARSNQPPTYNRTILELKRFSTNSLKSFPSLIIAPYWNWNKDRQLHYKWHSAYNRTILELKRNSIVITITVAISYNRTILELKLDFSAVWYWVNSLIIAPYWNWNLTPCS